MDAAPLALNTDETLGYCRSKLSQRHSTDIILRRAAMRANERARINPAVGIFAVTRPDKRRRELAHFEMQMCEILAISGADLSDLLPAPHLVARVHMHRLHMPVIRLHVFSFAI